MFFTQRNMLETKRNERKEKDKKNSFTIVKFGEVKCWAVLELLSRHQLILPNTRTRCNATPNVETINFSHQNLHLILSDGGWGTDSGCIAFVRVCDDTFWRRNIHVCDSCSWSLRSTDADCAAPHVQRQTSLCCVCERKRHILSKFIYITNHLLQS